MEQIQEQENIRNEIKKIVEKSNENTIYLEEDMDEEIIKEYYNQFSSDEYNTVSKKTFEEFKNEGNFKSELRLYIEDGKLILQYVDIFEKGNSSEDLSELIDEDNYDDSWGNELILKKLKEHLNL
jgi:hypothetical protein